MRKRVECAAKKGSCACAHIDPDQAVLRCASCAQELQQVKDTLIGEDVDGAVSGISGGERRRVSVGIGAHSPVAAQDSGVPPV
jgi:hypothetical protein